jgi:UDP-N-acetylmuramyl pentapeptide phosphotransferase/UDP-N-acetylglucosamine-1-phosphate transferase
MAVGEMLILAVLCLILQLSIYPHALVFARSRSLMKQISRPPGRLRPMALSILLLASFLFLFGLTMAMVGPRLDDEYYAPASQYAITAALLFSSLLLWSWGLQLDKKPGVNLTTLLVMLASYLMLWWAGLRIQTFRIPLIAQNEIQVSGGSSIVLTMAVLTVIASVVEWIDRLEGMALTFVGGCSLLVFLHAVWRSTGDNFVMLYALLLAVSCLGALLHNLPQNPRMLLGKSGGLLIGHWLAVLLVLARLKKPAAGLILPGLILGFLGLMIVFRTMERGINLKSPGQPATGSTSPEN